MEGLLANTDQLKGKMKEKVEANAELGRLSRKLAEIKLDCEVTFNADDYEMCEPDGAQVQEIFEELEFRRLKDQFIKLFSAETEPVNETTASKEPSKKEAQAAGSGQFSLFGANPSDSGATIKDVNSRNKIEDVSHFYQLVQPGLAMDLFLKQLMQQTSVCFDTETTSINPLQAELVGIAFSWNTGTGFYVAFPEEKESVDELIANLRPFFEADHIEKIGQNLKYEPELKEAKTEKLFEDIEVPLLRVLAAMESEGINLNKEFLGSLSTDLNTDIQNLEKSIYETAGEEFNIGSPKQLGEILFDKMKLVDKPKKTKTGQYSTAEDVLSYLAKDHEIIQNVLDYRGLAKLKSTYVDALPEQVEAKTGRVHTDYMQTVAATGRLSSNNPNLQNIPIRT